MLRRAFALFCSMMNLAGARSNSTIPTAQPIIIDTDIFSDVDDLGAIATANVLHNCGLADLRGVAINTQSRYGALATSVINTYYGNGHVPISILRPLTDETFLDTYGHKLGEFAFRVGHHGPKTLKSADDTPSPVIMYRTILAVAADASLHIISIGFLTNLADLLRSGADDISPLSGLDLVSTKVSELIIMGGRYPSGRDFNFRTDAPSAMHVLENWPKHIPITYSGGELGKQILSGQTLAQDAPPDSPVLAAYQWYVGRCQTTRESWDPVTVLYGVLGMDGFDALGRKPQFAFANEYGYNSIVMTDGSATNKWIDDETVTNQHWLRLADGVTNDDVSDLLNWFLTRGPETRGFEEYDAGLRVQ